MINLPCSDLRLYCFPWQNSLMTMKSAISHESSPWETLFRNASLVATKTFKNASFSDCFWKVINNFFKYFEH